MNLMIDDVLEFFENKNVSSTCQQCGNADSSVFSGNLSNGQIIQLNKMPLFLYTGLGREIHTSTELDLVSIACDNCGHIRSFLAQNILNFKKEKQNNE